MEGGPAPSPENRHHIQLDDSKIISLKIPHKWRESLIANQSFVGVVLEGLNEIADGFSLICPYMVCPTGTQLLARKGEGEEKIYLEG